MAGSFASRNASCTPIRGSSRSARDRAPNGEPGARHLWIGTAAGVVGDGADVILERQQRYAAGGAMVEIVKGGGPETEQPLACAVRETAEEIGVTAMRWDSLGAVYEIPSIVASPVHLFLARDCTFERPQPEGVESIELVRMPFGQAVEQARAGAIDDAVSALALLRAEAFLSRTSRRRTMGPEAAPVPGHALRAGGLPRVRSLLLARRNGVRVNDFALGMGPTLLKWTSPRSGTNYRLNLFPIGGYCAMKGEDGKSNEAEQQRAFRTAGSYDDDNFQAKTPLQRLAIVVAGPLANFLIAIVLLVGSFAIFGLPTASLKVGPVSPNMPAAKAGILAGDTIVAAEGRTLADGDDLVKTIQKSLGKPLHLTVRRDGADRDVTVVPVAGPDGRGHKVGIIGFQRRFEGKPAPLGRRS